MSRITFYFTSRFLLFYLIFPLLSYFSSFILFFHFYLIPSSLFPIIFRNVMIMLFPYARGILCREHTSCIGSLHQQSVLDCHLCHRTSRFLRKLITILKKFGLRIYTVYIYLPCYYYYFARRHFRPNFAKSAKIKA